MFQLMCRLVAFASLLFVGAGVVAESVPNDAKAVRPVAVGVSAPRFVARHEDGSAYAFEPRQLLRPTVLIFYRGGWCPYCNAHLGQLRTAEAQVKQLGYDVLFLSADRPEILRSSLKESRPTYTLLSDAAMQGARAFGIAFRMDDAAYNRAKSFGVDLEATSGEKHHQLPVPAVFIVDKNGIIRFAYANPDYTVRLKAEDLMAAAQRVLQQPTFDSSEANPR